MNLLERLQQLRQAFWMQFPMLSMMPSDINFYDGFAIVDSDFRHYRVDYIESDNQIVFDTFNNWQSVEPSWVSTVEPMVSDDGMPEMKSSKGFYVKSEDETTVTIAGYGVVFDSVDLDNEQFTKSTNFMLDTYTPIVLYDHDVNLGIFGKATNIEQTDYGLWFELELQKHNAYLEYVEKLINEKALGLSTGSIGHMVKKSGKHIDLWPVVEISLTTTPAEPKTLGLDFMEKVHESGIEQSLESDNTLKNDDDTLVNNSSELETKTEPKNIRINKMDENIVKQYIAEAMADFRKELIVKSEEPKDDSVSLSGEFGEQIKRILEIAETSQKRAEYITDDGGTKDNHVKSFADFLVAIKRNDLTRLSKVYGATKDVGLDSGASGGFLIPDEFQTNLLQLSLENSEILNRVTRIPVNGNTGTYPALDQFLTPTAGVGDTAFAGGLVATNAGAGSSGGSLTETQPQFEQLRWTLHKAGGYVEVDNEMVDDSPLAIETLLTSLFSVAIAAKKEYWIIRGTGAGEPLGILNSNALVNVTPATNNLFSWVDATTMYSRFKRASNNPVWIVHPSVWPDIFTMEIGTAGSGAFVANLQTQSVNVPLMNFDILNSEHSPQANNSGDVILADLSAYLLFERQGLRVDFSPHAGFTNDQATWRFTERIDGMPWLRSAITLGDPTGSYTVSSFISHND